MAFNKKDPDRRSRFVWTSPDDVVIIKATSDEKPPSDTKAKSAPGDHEAPGAAAKDDTDDHDQTDKP